MLGRYRQREMNAKQIIIKFVQFDATKLMVCIRLHQFSNIFEMISIGLFIVCSVYMHIAHIKMTVTVCSKHHVHAKD